MDAGVVIYYTAITKMQSLMPSSAVGYPDMIAYFCVQEMAEASQFD